MRLHKPFFALLIVAALSAACIGQAQENQPDQKPSATELINLRFAGGTVADYVAAVSRAAGGVNVVVVPEAAQVSMPAIELQQVTVSAALGVVNGRTHFEDRRAIQLVYSAGGTFAEDERPIYSIGANMTGIPRGQLIVLHNRVWSIAGMQNLEVTSDDMLTAIQAALDLIGKDQEPAQLRLHEATGILIARGTEDQLETIDNVIEQLQRSAQLRQAAREAAAQPDAEKVELKKQVNDQAKIIEQLQAQIAKLTRGQPRDGRDN